MHLFIIIVSQMAARGQQETDMAEIEFENRDGVGLITFARPDRLNVVSWSMLTELGELYRRCDTDAAVRVVVITGRGSAFCAGADLSRADAFAAAAGGDFSSCPLSMQAWDMRKPVIAACNGHAIGVGLGIALQCDLRIVARAAKYGLLQNRRGVVADFGVEWVLPRLIGLERAFEMLVRGARIDGAQAHDWGLAAYLADADSVLATALDIATDMVHNCSPLVMAMHKRLLWRGLEMPREAFISLETRALHHSMSQPDALEGATAWVEKRTPRWDDDWIARWPDFL